MAGEGNVVECDRCGDPVSLETAVELRQEDNLQMVKTLCPDCIGAIGTPQGYELRRDLSYRMR
jgi:hypothetical protein